VTVPVTNFLAREAVVTCFDSSRAESDTTWLVAVVGPRLKWLVAVVGPRLELFSQLLKASKGLSVNPAQTTTAMA
jgi:hypothetical protein